jgi:hypothetical protein
LWSFKGIPETNDSAVLVYDYNMRRTLASLGYRFTDEAVDDFEAQYLTFIHHHFEKLRHDEEKRALRKRK